MTEWIVWTIQSFCISVAKRVSMKNSKNSQSTPTVMEKQKATTARKSGESLKVNFSLRLKISTSAKPMAAMRKPLIVWSMVSHEGMRV